MSTTAHAVTSPRLMFSRTALFIRSPDCMIHRIDPRPAHVCHMMSGVARAIACHATPLYEAHTAYIVTLTAYARQLAGSLAQALRSGCARRRVRRDRRGRYASDRDVAELDQILRLHLSAHDVLHELLGIADAGGGALRVHVLDAPELILARADVIRDSLG